MGTGERVTIADVALAAGVSVPTVSKVLNGRAGVSAATRELVEVHLADAGYRRGPQGPRTPPPAVSLVGLVLHELDSPYALEVLRGAEAAVQRAGAALMVTTTGRRQSVSRRHLRTLLSGTQPAAVVLVTAEPEPAGAELLASLGTPVVLMDPLGGADPGLPTVGATNWRGGLAATEHLLSLGHERIAVLGGEPHAACAMERVDGWRAALGRAGVPVDEELVEWGDFDPQHGRRSARRLLDLPEPPTAIFAGSDMQAVGVYAEARERGLRIPHDLSVVGFDDVILSRHLSPPLTTVRQPLAQMAGQAVRLALEVGSGAAPPTTSHVQLATELVVRESTAPPPARSHATSPRPQAGLPA